MDQGRGDFAEAAGDGFPPPGSRFVREADRRAGQGRTAAEASRGAQERAGADGRFAAPARGYHVDDYLDDGNDLDGFTRAATADAAPVREYTAEVEDESFWGPRPRLMADEPGGRRTVVITGRLADRHVAPRGGAPRARGPAHAHIGFPADRTAMWAVLLCVILLLVALTSH